MDIKIEIPVKPLVKSYLEYIYKGKIQIDKYNIIGKYLLVCLQKKMTDQNHKYKEYPDKVIVSISDYFFRTNGCFLTETSIIDFNNFVIDYMYELMFETIDTYEESTRDEFIINKAIQVFMDRYSLTAEEFHMGTALKAYYRYKNPAKQA